MRVDQVILGLNEDRVDVRLDADRDVDLLLALLSVAISITSRAALRDALEGHAVN